MECSHQWNAVTNGMQVDGVLARAIVHGGWVLMDNANLCNPTVLDRLNPLLEPNGECCCVCSHKVAQSAVQGVQ